MSTESSGGPESQVWILDSQEHSATMPSDILRQLYREYHCPAVQHLGLTVLRKKIPEAPPEPTLHRQACWKITFQEAVSTSLDSFSSTRVLQRGLRLLCHRTPGKYSFFGFYFDLMAFINKVGNYQDVEKVFKRLRGILKYVCPLQSARTSVPGFL